MTPFPRANFKALCANLLGLHPAYVTWTGEPDASPMKPDPAYLWASLEITSRARKRVGWDDLRRTDNADGSWSTQQVGRRQVVLSLKLKMYESPAKVFADDTLDEFISRLWQPVNLETLNGMQLVFEDCGPVMSLPTVTNSRYISAANVDLTVALAVTDAASYPGPNRTIGEAIGTGTVTGEETATLPFDVKENVHP